METPAYEKTQRHVRLGRSIRKILRGKHKAQWVDTKQIIGDPEIYDFLGDIKGEEIDNEILYVSRKYPKRAPKIELEINENASVEYIKSNSSKCKKNETMRPAKPRPRKPRRGTAVCDGKERNITD